MPKAVPTFVILFALVLVTVVPITNAAAPASFSQPLARSFDGSLLSTNWSGYAVNGSSGSVTMAQASWVVPSVICPKSGNLYSSYWVGIDGFQSSTVEQTGTDSDCRNGVPTYYAWLEFFPKPSQVISGITVHPGDVIAARITFSSGTFKVAIKDMTTGQVVSKSSAVSGAARNSAEFIVEAPVVCSLLRCKLAPLADFGTASFGQDYTQLQVSCALTMGGQTGVIGTFGSSVQEMTMISQANQATVKAQPSTLSADGSSFTVQWVSSGP